MADIEHKLPLVFYDIEQETFTKIDNCLSVNIGKVIYNDNEQVLYIYDKGELVQYKKKVDKDNKISFNEC